MFAAPELVIAELVELLHEIEIAAELQHRMLADRVMRGEEGSEFQAGHDVFSQAEFAAFLGRKLRADRHQRNRSRDRAGQRNAAMRRRDGSRAVRAVFWRESTQIRCCLPPFSV
jgi:hypothetical protein